MPLSDIADRVHAHFMAPRPAPEPVPPPVPRPSLAGLFRVRTRLFVGGRYQEPGATVELSDADARLALQHGSVERLGTRTSVDLKAIEMTARVEPATTESTS